MRGLVKDVKNKFKFKIFFLIALNYYKFKFSFFLLIIIKKDDFALNALDATTASELENRSRDVYLKKYIKYII